VKDLRSEPGTIFAIDQTAIHDGPGVRMNVYVKGCPLRCIWCHSPESQSQSPEVAWYETRCVRCGACVQVCPKGLREFDASAAETDGCQRCGACVQACDRGALAMKGARVFAGEVLDEARRLKPFFKRTGGGVTLTGGEPVLQPAFVRAIAALCREEGIHVAVETCGYAPWPVFEDLAPVVDLFLYDLKLLDEVRHKALTGVSNRKILKNLGRLAASGAEIIARIPLIPGVNDDDETLESMAALLRDLGVSRA
jgi:pyruvate formate lyase activating enzyme